MKFSVCVDALFWGKDIYEAIELVGKCGVPAIEFWSWQDKDLDKIKEMMGRLNLQIAAICTDPISLTDPAQHEAYLAALKETVAAANKLGCKGIITQVGNDTGMREDFQFDAIVKGLKESVPMLEEAGITLFAEPLNTRVDHAGYYLNSSDEAFEIIDAVGSENVKVLFDIYHQQIMEGDVTRRLLASIDKIGHFHAAGNPGRHEIYYGEINYRAIFEEIKKTAYDGCVGLEYFPLDAPEKGLLEAAKLQ